MVIVTKSAVIAPLMAIFVALLYTTAINAETVELGACFHHDTNSYRCAMNSDFCRKDYDEVWIRPIQLKLLDGRRLCSCADAHIGNCSPSHGYRGNCAHEERACPADNAYFRSSPYFYNDGASCMCHGMVAHPQSTRTIEGEPTLYGACKSDGDLRCAVYSTDCDAGTERWLSPGELYALGEEPCKCDKVRTGSCVAGPTTTCAINNDSCTSDSVFTAAKRTKDKGVDCFLCSSGQIGISSDDDDKANADDDDKANADDDDKAKADDDDKANADDDDKANADDDDKANADDDDKAKADDDDDGAVLLANRVSKKKFSVVLGFMITSLCTSMILVAFIVVQRKMSPMEGTKSTDGSVL